MFGAYATDEIYRRGERMKCESCDKSFKRKELISTETGLVCQKCMDKSLGINRCHICNRPHAKWPFCLNCGAINYKWKPADYVKSEDLGK